MVGATEVVYPPNCAPVQANQSVNELVPRLKAIAEALQEAATNEEVGDPHRYRGLALHLVKRRFLDNNSREVRIHLACCLANLLRIFAPDTPIGDPHELKEMLLFLVRALGGLDSPSDPQFRRYYYLLENLVVVKSLQLALDLGDEAQPVIRLLIKTAFGVVKPSATDADSKIRELLMELIIPLIQGVDQISNSVLDAVFYFIVNPQKMNNRESYRMARNLLQRCQTTFEPCIQLFLNQALSSGEMPDECDLVGPNKNKLYEIIFELHELIPDVLYSVLPQLEAKFQVDDDTERRLAVDLVGRLCSAAKSRVPDELPQLWTGYLGRFKDRSVDIRLRCVEQAEHLLLVHSTLRSQITEALIARSRDTDDSVRLATVATITKCAKKKLGCVSEALLECAVERARDKKYAVRKEAMLSLGTLYRKVQTGEEYTESERASLNSIQQKLLLIYYHNVNEDRLLVEKVFTTCLVPYMLETKKRMETLIMLYASLETNPAKAFEEIIRRLSRIRHTVEEVRRLVVEGKASLDARDSPITALLRVLAEQHPEPAKAEVAFRNFFARVIAVDERANTQLAYIGSQEYETRKAEEAVKELFDKTATAGLSTEQCAIVKSLLERAAPLLIDANAGLCLSTLVRDIVVRANFGETHALRIVERALRLLKLVGENYVVVFAKEPTVIILKEMLASEHTTAVEVSLLLLTKIAAHRNDAIEDLLRSLIAILERIAIDGTPRQAKYAVRCLVAIVANVDERTRILRRIFDASVTHIHLSDALCETALYALSTVVSMDASTFATELKDVIRTTIVSQIVLSDVTGSAQPVQHKQKRSLDGDGFPEEEHEVNGEIESSMVDTRDANGEMWVSEDRLPHETRAKLAGMKLMTRFLCAMAPDGDSLLSKTLHMFATIIDAKGDLHGNDKISEWEKGHLRVAAGCCILKLAEWKVYASQITLAQFQSSAQLLADPLSDVRQRYALRLHKGLVLLRLSVEYMGQLAIAGLVKDDREFMKQIANCIDVNITKRREIIRKKPQEMQLNLPYYLPEYCIAYAVHLLAHQKSYVKHDDIAVLSELRDCLWLLLGVFAAKAKDVRDKDPHSRDNFHFIYRLLQDIKDSSDHQVADFTDKKVKLEQNKKMWTLCDVGMLLLSYRVNHVTKEVPSKSLLSKRFFDPPSDPNKGNTEVYVPAQLIDEEKRGQGKHKTTTAFGKAEISRANASKRPANSTKAGASRKRVSTATASNARGEKRVKRDHVKKDDSDADENDAGAETSDGDETPLAKISQKTTARQRATSTTAVAKKDEKTPEKKGGNRSPSRRGARPVAVNARASTSTAKASPSLSPRSPHRGARLATNRRLPARTIEDEKLIGISPIQPPSSAVSRAKPEQRMQQKISAAMLITTSTPMLNGHANATSRAGKKTPAVSPVKKGATASPDKRDSQDDRETPKKRGKSSAVVTKKPTAKTSTTKSVTPTRAAKKPAKSEPTGKASKAKSKTASGNQSSGKQASGGGRVLRSRK